MTIYSTTPRVTHKFELKAFTIKLHPLNAKKILGLDHILTNLSKTRKQLLQLKSVQSILKIKTCRNVKSVVILSKLTSQCN